MTNKSEYVDLIGEATRQRRRRTTQLRLVPAPVEVEQASRLSRWPPALFRQWKLETLTRWKAASWKLKDWL